MLPFMKILGCVPGLVELIEAGYIFTIEKIPETTTTEEKYRYQIGAKKDWKSRKIVYAAPTLEEAIEKFVVNISQYVKEHQ